MRKPFPDLLIGTLAGIIAAVIYSLMLALMSRIAKWSGDWSIAMAVIAGGAITILVGFCTYLSTRLLFYKKQVAQRVRLPQNFDPSLSLTEFCKNAEREIFLVAASLPWIVSFGKDFLFSKCAQNVNVKLMLTDPDSAAVPIHGDHASPQGARQFISELDLAKTTFCGWLSEAESKGYSLQIRKYPIIECGYCVVDGFTETGNMFFYPYLYRTSLAMRQCVVLSRQHNLVGFETHYESLNKMWEIAKPLCEQQVVEA